MCLQRILPWNLCGCFLVSGVFACNTHICFEVVDRPFNENPDFIESIPFRRITSDAGEHTEFHMFTGISKVAE